MMANLQGHRALVLKIQLVSDEGNHDVGARLPLQLLDPGLCTGKRLRHCDIIGDNRRLGPTVVHGGKAVISCRPQGGKAAREKEER